MGSKGIPYFSLHTDLLSDRRVKLLRAEFGIKGFGIWIDLLIQIYADEGYFLKWDDETKLLFASDVGESGNLVDEVVKGSVKRGLFDKSVFDQFKVLTSKRIQETYLNAIKRRTTETEIDARFLCLPPSADIISGNVNISLKNVDRSAQSRVEKSKEEESRVKGAPAWKHTPPDDLLQVEGFAEVWADWEEHRRAIGKKMTKVAAERIWKRLLKWDYDPVAILNRSIENGWTGIFEPGKQKHGANNKRKTKGDEAVEFLTGNWN